MKHIKKRLIICGFGNVGQAFVELIAERQSALKQRYGLDLQVAAVVNSGGAAVAKKGGLPTAELLSHIKQGGALATIKEYGRRDLTAREIISSGSADVLIEATPTNLVDGQPAYSHIQDALNCGMDIVSANKGPLVLYYAQLHDLAETSGCKIYLSAATAAALPTLDIGQLSIAGTTVLGIEAILNGTTNYILTRMQVENCSYQTALEAAREMGIAETDPSLDVEGQDTGNKIILIANRVFGVLLGPTDVNVTGITGITPEDIVKARSEDKVIKLLGTGGFEKGRLQLKVEPAALDRTHPLAAVNYTEKGISYLTDTMGRITVTGGRSSPVGAAAALLKDVIQSSMFR
jgi:homoserine dehydrogenase